MTKSIVLIQQRIKYGRVLTYPVNLAAQLITRLIGRKTLKAHEIQLIDRLGFEVEYVPTSVDAESLDNEWRSGS